MRIWNTAIVLMLSVSLLGVSQQKKPARRRPAPPAPATGIMLEDLTSSEAAKVLTPDTIVVIPIGAAAKAQAPDQRLNGDWTETEYLKKRLLERAQVVIAPTVTYFAYPGAEENPGSISLRLETAEDQIVDICRSLARHGPRRFYALETGGSTAVALSPAAETLASEGILLRYPELRKTSDAAGNRGGTAAVAGLETGLLTEIAALRGASLPAAQPGAGRAGGPRAAAEEAAIRKQFGERYVDAWLKGDAKTMASLWTADGDVGSMETGSVKQGQAAVSEMWAGAFSRRPANFSGRMRNSIESVRFVKPDVAIVEGTFDYNPRPGKDGREVLAQQERYTVVMTKRASQWLIASSRVMEVPQGRTK